MAQDWAERAPFTDESRAAGAAAAAAARALRHPYLGTEHLLVGLLVAGGNAGAALAATGVTLAGARQAVRFVVGEGDQPTSSPLAPTPRLQAATVRAVNYAGGQLVDPAHLLRGILADEDCIAAGVLSGLLHVQLDQLRERLMVV